ncbi:NAD+ synthase (glutamine-hydrolysing) [Pseudokineococcus lusitanus]|uniref:Glutamine-dependent NAD(+) synthetase n=2 Tax=Pseudokineococcus lusitanus TaxID=763993 RepID=A0A3N1G9J1_9ACTN|nr:NAD+ synthase (glutamine-hydrolysing) [Pseudokineococcus lusitanus]
MSPGYARRMPSLRLALAQVDTTVGDLDGNAALVRRAAADAAAAGADLLVLPELALTGYPVEDLALRRSFVDASRDALHRLAEDLAADGHGDLPVLVGYVDRAEGALADGVGPSGRGHREGGPEAAGGGDEAPGVPKGLPQNCAALLHGGRRVGRYAKHHLPNYGVFDEFRVFVPGRDLLVARVRGVDVAVAVCEDLWQDGGPVAAAREADAELLVVLNASPYERAKDDTRLALCRHRAAQAGAVLAYVNAVGGQDDLVFDGGSLVVGEDGAVLARGESFAEQLLVVDLELPEGAAEPADVPGVTRVEVSSDPAPAREPVRAPLAEPLDDMAELWAALVLGLGDYARKNGFSQVLFGLSGGIDSAVCAALAVDALGPGGMVGVSMPSGYSTAHSRTDADDLAERLGIDYRLHPIAPMVDAFLANVPMSGVAEENLQARVRGTLLMGISNSEGQLVLATSNKSELSVGYSTIYGDSVGGFAPLKDVAKTDVWRLARWRNAAAEARGERPPIPEASITKAPSAELRPDQTDQDSLPEYDVLDALLEDYVVRAMGRSELLEAGHALADVERVVGLVDRAEWKRRQGAPGPKTTAVAFGRDRRLPITTHWREEDE